MNFCMSIRGYSRDVPLLWISDQAEFEPQSHRLQVDDFWVKPITEHQLGKQSSGFFREKGEVMNQVRRKRMNKKYYRREQNRHAIKKIMTTGEMDMRYKRRNGRSYLQHWRQ